MKRLINVSMILVLLLGFMPQATATAEVLPLWEQLPNGEGAIQSEIGSTLHADNFNLTEASSIGGIEIWSNYAGPYDLTFNIYANDDTGEYSIPGILVHSEVVYKSSGVEDEICPQNGSYYYCRYRYTLSFDPPLELAVGDYWLSVYGSAGSDFGWSYAYSNPDSPFFAVSLNNTTTWMGDWTNALAFRLLEPQLTCPTTVEVANTNDSGEGSLRQAIVDVCPGGTINFDSTLSAETITLSSELILDKDLTIDGSALANKVSISGNNLYRVFGVYSGTTVILDSLIVADGNTDDGASGGGISNQGTLTITNSVLSNNDSSWVGGGIYNDGDLTIMNSIVEENNAELGGGGVHNSTSGILSVKDNTIINNSSSIGGGLYNEGQLTLSGSTLIGNRAEGSSYSSNGGGIYNFGTATVANCTFTQNFATLYGSGIYNFGAMTLYNSTLAGNSGSTTLVNTDSTGRLYFANTIIADTTGSSDCLNSNGGVIVSNYHNLVEDGSCPTVAVNPVSGDPMLAALADNGGPTQTMALQTGSGAIDAGDDTICAAPPVDEVDQRGYVRPYGEHCDIGAYELTRGNILPETLPVGEAETHYSQQLTVEGGVAPFDWWWSGSLPTGFGIWPSGELFGDPLVAGTFIFTAYVTDSNELSGSRDYSLIILPALTFNPSTLPPARVNAEYYQEVTVSGRTDETPVLTLDSGTLPTGISFNGTAFTGTPTLAGIFADIVIKASYTDGQVKTKTYTLSVINEHFFSWSPELPGEKTDITFTPDAGFSSYYWTTGYSPGEACSEFGAYGNPGVIYNYYTSGQFQVCLKVSDSYGNELTDSQWVTVANTLEPVVYEIYHYPEPSLPGEAVSVDFDYDSGPSPFSCEVDWGDGTAKESIACESFSEDQPEHTYTEVGTYTIQVWVTDGDDLTGTASTQHHVVYYYASGPDFWLTSNAVPTTIVLEAYAAAGHTPLTFNISSDPSHGGLGTPTLIDCYPLDPQVLNSAPVSPAISAAGPAPQALPEGKQTLTDLAALREIASSNEVLVAESRMLCLANIIYTPTITDPLYVGWDSFSFTVSDGVNTASAPANVALYLAANTPPVAQNSSLEVLATEPSYVVLTATDPDHYDYNGDRLSFSIDDSLTAGTLGMPSWPNCDTVFDNSWNPLGVKCTSTVLYTPAAGVTGDSFTFKVNDSHYDSNVATVSLIYHIPTTLTVNVVEDADDGSCDTTHCSLREAILYSGPGDTVNFDLSEQPPVMITLVNRQLVIDNDLTIVGPGADQLSISGGAELLDENPHDHDRVFSIGAWEGAPVNVSISGLTIRDGRSDEGGGVKVYPGNTLYMEDCVIGPNNIVTYAGGGITSYGGDVTLNRCTVTENEGTGSLGGAGVTTAYNGATTTLINSTISGNITNNFGGGIYVFDATVRLIHTTVSGNLSNANWMDEYEERGGGAGIYIDYGGQVELQNSIVAGNTDLTYNVDPKHPDYHVAWPDIHTTDYGSITSLGGNLIGNPTGLAYTWDSSDQVGSAEFPLDPLLGELAWNAPGTTQTMALQTDSPAIDTAACAEGIDQDQRGVTRPQGGACDIGAYELEQAVTTGSLKISKVFDPLESGFSGDFTIFYDCGGDFWAYITLAAGESQTFNDIPLGSQCTVSEPTLPTPPTGWTFGTPTYNPADGIVTISETLAQVVVTNVITEDDPGDGEPNISTVFLPLIFD